MHLHGEGVGGVDQLEQQREVAEDVIPREGMAVLADQLRQGDAGHVAALQAGDAADLEALAGGHLGDVLAEDCAQLLAAPGGQLAAAEGRHHAQGQQRAVLGEALFVGDVALLLAALKAQAAGLAHAQGAVEAAAGAVVLAHVAAQAVAAQPHQDADDVLDRLVAQAVALQHGPHGETVEHAGAHAEEPVDLVVSRLHVQPHGDGDGHAVLAVEAVQPARADVLAHHVLVGIDAPCPLVGAALHHIVDGVLIQFADGVKIGLLGFAQNHVDLSLRLKW